MTTLTLPTSKAFRLGRWWFQNRSLSPLPLFLLFVLLPPAFDWALQPRELFYGLLLGIAFAEGIRIWAVGYAGSITRTRGDKVSQLVHAGPFRFVRNPLYLANILLYTLCGFLFGFAYLSAVVFAYSVIQYFFIVSYEETLLTQTFGEAYVSYQNQVPKWLPSLTPQIEASPHTFDLARALRSERSTFISIALMGVLFFIKQWAF